ncbi:MAG: GNAT family N-acetyltransferase [Eubacteriaceae bacterium]|nr:GNAT family N-acetyltransferase [Eubacteriaceae bacterium]
MNIRIMKKEDYESLYALWLSCTGMGLNDVDDSYEGIAKYIDRNPETSFVAEKDGKIVGAIMAGHDGRRGYIHHTAVSPDHRSEGIGKALVDAAVDALKKEGISKVNLVVFARNEGGNAFWEKIGFTQRFDLAYRNKTLVKMVRHDT